MSVYDDAKKALQDFLAPELNEIKGEMKAINARLDALTENINIRFESMEKIAEMRFAAIMRELAIDKRIEKLERDRTEGKAN